MGKTINLISITIGIIGIVFGVYFHYSTKEKKEITYYLNSESFKIYDKDLIKESRKISLYINDSIMIDQNVYITTFSIWNSGNVPIDQKDVRKDLIINFGGIKEVIDYEVIKEVEPEVSHFLISQLTHSSFNLKWKYFDPGDGIKMQIIYTGTPHIKSIIDGKILKTNIKEFITMQDKKDTRLLLFLGPAAILFLSLLLFGSKKLGEKIFRLSPVLRIFQTKPLRIIIYVTFILYLILVPLLFWIYFSQLNINPF